MLEEITVSLAALNPLVLDAALREALGELIVGVSAGRGDARIHLTRPAHPDEAERIRQIVAAHDPAEPSAEQRQAEACFVQMAGLESELARLDLSAPLAGPALEMAVRWLLLRMLRQS